MYVLGRVLEIEREQEREWRKKTKTEKGKEKEENVIYTASTGWQSNRSENRVKLDHFIIIGSQFGFQKCITLTLQQQ